MNLLICPTNDFACKDNGQSWISKMGGHQFFLIELQWSGGDRKIKNHYQRTNDFFPLGIRSIPPRVWLLGKKEEGWECEGNPRGKIQFTR